MTTSSQRKGDAFERDVRDWLRDNGHPSACRLRPSGVDDRGDLGGIGGWTLELKCYPKDPLRAIREGLADLAHEQANAGTPYGAVIAKRPGVTDPGSALVVMELRGLLPLLAVGR